MKKLFRGQRGFTLIEVLVSVGILSMVSSFLGGALFQAIDKERKMMDDGIAIAGLGLATHWFAKDAQRATNTNLVAGGPAVPSVTLTLKDEFGGALKTTICNYAVVGTNLARDCGGEKLIVAKGVVSTAFSVSGRMVTAQIEVEAASDTTKTHIINVLMKPGA